MQFVVVYNNIHVVCCCVDVVTLDMVHGNMFCNGIQ